MVELYLLDRGIDPHREHELGWHGFGKLPFDLVYRRAARMSTFWRQEDLDHLPYKFLLIYRESPECTESVIWRCHFCGFWCDVFDQRLMEEHLCSLCPLIPEFDKLQLRGFVLEQALQQIGGLLGGTSDILAQHYSCSCI